jgi:hypothetical protein
MDVWFSSDLRAVVLAGVVLSVRTARAQGLGNVEFVAGILALAEHQALAFKVSWPDVLCDVRQVLGDGYAGLLDGSVALIEE